MYRIGICDDNEAVVKEIEQNINMLHGAQEHKLEVCSYTDAKDFLDDLENEQDYAVVFLDIELGKCNGIDIAKLITEKRPETMIIFMTAYSQYIYESFQVRPIGFIEKPIKKEVVEDTLLRALKAIDDLPTLNYSFKGRQYRLLLKKIAYLESKERKIILGKVSGEEEVFYGKLDEIEKQIDRISGSFCRIGQSVIINMRYVRSISFNTVVVEADGIDKEFGISRRYKDKVQEKYMEFVRRG